MKNQPLFVLLTAAALFVWFVPRGTEGQLVEAPGASPPRDQHLKIVQERPAQVVLPRQPDGHFYADVIVNAAASNMLVDTGATVVALTARDAAAMGIRWNETEVRPVARGASGDIYGVRVMLDNVRVGGLEARGVMAVVVPEGLPVSLLGQSFLSRVGNLQIQSNRMILGS